MTKITVVGHHAIYDAMLERARDDLGWPQTPAKYLNIDDEIADFDCMYDSMLAMQEKITEPIVQFNSDDTSCPVITMDAETIEWLKNNKNRLIQKWKDKAEEWSVKSYRYTHYGDYGEAVEASELCAEFENRCTALEKAIQWLEKIST